jgi:hypothetical protein
LASSCDPTSRNATRTIGSYRRRKSSSNVVTRSTVESRHRRSVGWTGPRRRTCRDQAVSSRSIHGRVRRMVPGSAGLRRFRERRTISGAPGPSRRPSMQTPGRSPVAVMTGGRLVTEGAVGWTDRCGARTKSR